jgi:hypothetical protein
MTHRAHAALVAFGLAVFAFATPAGAFKLAPNGSPIERALVKKDQRAMDRVASTMIRFGIDKVGEPVHEEITNLMFGCPGGQPICADPEYDSGLGYVLAGVRWNDDPPFEFAPGFGNYPGCPPGKVVRLVTFAECWARVFLDGQRRAAAGERLGRQNAPLLVRSHFGDLQFLHAMASRDGEPAIETHTRIMMWAEFTWKVATLKLGPGDVIVDVPVAGMREVFSGHGWNVQDLFAQGNAHVRKPKYLAEFAFGSLLHLVQDSFSAAHVRREKPVVGRTCGASASMHAAPGRISQFSTATASRTPSVTRRRTRTRP